MALPGVGDVGLNHNWRQWKNVEVLKHMCKGKGASAFITYKEEGPNAHPQLKGAVVWKKFAYQV